MIFPRLIYETLPAVYLGSGVASATLIQSSMAMIPGFLFSFSALLVVLMRVNYRRDRSAVLKGIKVNAKIESQRKKKWR